MKLEVVRKNFTEHSTIGDLLIDGIFFSFTLEDTVREVKIPKETAIPYGTYQVITNHSDRFGKIMPLILNVEGFKGVRIHNGSYAGDTEGCILIGYKKAENMIYESKKAFKDFMPILQNGLEAGMVTITISKG